MPKNTPIMRAPTGKERIADTIRGAYDSLSEQPLVRIMDMLGLSNIKGVANEDPNAMKMGVMSGGPSKGLSALAPKRSSLMNSMYMPDELLSEVELARRNKFRSEGYQGMVKRDSLGNPLAPDIERMHPSVPPEFHAVEKPRMPESRTAPIDMNNPPSGKIEYLDPDVAEYMNPSRIDATTREGQRRLRFLTGK